MVNDDIYQGVSFTIRNMVRDYIIILTALFFITPVSLSSQSLEIAGGMIHNRFFDFGNKDFHVGSTYESGKGYFINISVDDLIVDSLRMRFDLAIENFNGKSSTGYYGLGGSNSIVVNVEKSMLSATFYPLVINIKNLIDLDFGIAASVQIREVFTGKFYSRLGPDFNEQNIRDKYATVSNDFNIGLRARVAYDFFLTKNLILSPQYSFYLSLTNELEEFYCKTKSMRHFIGIGIEKKLK